MISSGGRGFSGDGGCRPSPPPSPHSEPPSSSSSSSSSGGSGASGGDGGGDDRGRSGDKDKGRERSPSPAFWKEGELHNRAHSAAEATRLNAYLHLQQEGILDGDGKLTEYAIDKAQYAFGEKSELKNELVIEELTKDGSDINDWQKLTTPSITLSTGQRVQVHFYKHKTTNEVNYNVDFKVKGEVRWCSKKPTLEPKVPPYGL